MAFNKTIILFVFAFILTQSIGLGQGNYSFRNIVDDRTGFSPKYISDIVMDKEGFIWLASNNGLYKWDGISLKHFHHDSSDSLTIGGNDINRGAILYDSLSERLIIGVDDELCFFDPVC